MKRIAAVAALTVAMLAAPAAAMASTSRSGSGSDHPGPSQLVCPRPFLLHHRHVSVLRTRYFRHHRNRRIRGYCPFPPPFPQACQVQSFTFDMAPWSVVFVNNGPSITDGTGHLLCSG